MKMFKKVAICVVLSLCMLLSFVACAGDDFSSDYGEELIVNGSFEDGLNGWEVVGADDAHTASVTVETRSSGTQEEEEFGSKYLVIKNTHKNETYLKQTVRVEKGATYKIDSDIYIKKAITGDSAKKFKGAYIGIEEKNGFVPVDKKTASTTWGTGTACSYYFTSSFDTLTITLRLGTYDNMVEGIAHFDGVSLTKVDESLLPTGTVIHDIDEYVPEDGGVAGILYVVLGAILVPAFTYGIWVAIRRKGYYNRAEDKKDSKLKSFIKKYYPLAIVLFVALAGRIALSINYLGNSADMEAYASAATKLSSTGLASYYTSSSQKILPFYLYILWACGGIVNLFGAKSAIYTIVKIPAMLCELGIIVMIYKLAKKFIGDRGAILCAALIAFIPSMLTAISVWGEMDSIAAFIALVMFYAILNPCDMSNTKKFIIVFVCLLLGVMTKVEFLWLVPIAITYVIYTFIKKNDTRLVIGLSAGVALVLFYLLSLPFCMNYVSNGRAFYIFEKYFEIAFNGTHHYSQDAFNLYAIVGLNWRSASLVSVIMNAVFGVILFAFTIFVYMKNKSRLELILIAAFTMIGAYTFAIDMSPTVLVTALVLLLAYAVVSNEKRAFLLFTVYSLIMFLNCSVLLNSTGSLAVTILSAAKFASNDAFLIIMSVLNTLLLFYFIYIIYDICINDRIKQIEFIEGDDVATVWGRLTYRFKRNK